MEEQLIAAVYKRRTIWDPSDKLRKNSNILKSLWTEVAKEINVDVKVAKNKWKNLRAYFVSQMRELDKPRSGSGGDVKMTSSWGFYNQLLFLKDVSKFSEHIRDDSLAATETSQFCDQTQVDNHNDSDVDDLIDSSILEIHIDENIGTDITSTFAMANESLDSTYQPETSKEIPARQKMEDNPQTEKKSDFRIRRANIYKRKLSNGPRGIADSRDELIEVERRKVLLLEKEISAEEDPDLLFFKSLLPYLKQFTPIQKLRIRTKIQNLILAEYETAKCN